MLKLTRKTRDDWFRELNNSPCPASVSEYAIRTHLGLAPWPGTRQRLYEDMDNSGLVAPPVLIHYYGYDRIFFVNQSLREQFEDDVDIKLLENFRRGRVLQRTREFVRNHSFERFDGDLYEGLKSGNYNDWPPGQGQLLKLVELEPGYPCCKFERLHHQAFAKLNK